MYKVYAALVHLGNWAPGQLGVLGSWVLGPFDELIPVSKSSTNYYYYYYYYYYYCLI
jgi:hypothetical protein